MDSKRELNYRKLSGFDLAMIWLLIRPANKAELKNTLELINTR